MLVLKKISTKKLIIYVSTIILMLGGTGFIFYQNQNLAHKKSLVIDNPVQSGELMTAGVAVSGDQALPQGSLAKPLRAADLNIFSSQKFKELKENILISQENSPLGKRDPFQPN